MGKHRNVINLKHISPNEACRVPIDMKLLHKQVFIG